MAAQNKHLRVSASAPGCWRIWTSPSSRSSTTVPGVSEEQQQQIFEPFFTTAQKGTGLGLYIARELCESNGAKLRYYDNPGGGSCFRIELPAGETQ